MQNLAHCSRPKRLDVPNIFTIMNYLITCYLFIYTYRPTLQTDEPVQSEILNLGQLRQQFFRLRNMRLFVNKTCVCMRKRKREENSRVSQITIG